jgi:hypothetical protein
MRILTLQSSTGALSAKALKAKAGVYKILPLSLTTRVTNGSNCTSIRVKDPRLTLALVININYGNANAFQPFFTSPSARLLMYMSANYERVTSGILVLPLQAIMEALGPNMNTFADLVAQAQWWPMYEQNICVHGYLLPVPA